MIFSKTNRTFLAVISAFLVFIAPPITSSTTSLGVGGGETSFFSQSDGFAIKKDLSSDTSMQEFTSSDDLMAYQSKDLLMPTTGIYTQFFHWGHRGIDIANPTTPTVFSAKGGVIVEAKIGGWNGGYGKYVLVDHGNGLMTRYAHLQKIFVQQGQTVVGGAPIGDMGSTGRSTGNHLHFEVIKDGIQQNPLAFL